MTDVTLSISRTNPGGWSEATHVKKDGKNSDRRYYYQFTGGNTAENDGTIKTAVGTPITFTVTLSPNNAALYTVAKVSYSGNDNSECSNTATGGTSVSITDASKKNDTTEYAIRVQDEGDPNGKAKFTCDPKIINVPT